MQRRRSLRGHLRQSRFSTAVSGFAVLTLAVGVVVASIWLFGGRAETFGTLRTIPGAGAAGARVLHVRGVRSEAGGRTTAPASLEAWLDETTNEGKIVEIGSNGLVQRIESFSGDTYVLYLGDARHGVIRRGVGADSPFATRVRDNLRYYQIAVQRGSGRVVGSGRSGGQPTDRVQLDVAGRAVLADVDRATGLTLREEGEEPGGARLVRETAYTLVEYADRSRLPANVFQADLPPDATREEYTEDRGGNRSQAPAGLPYAVYAAPTSAGSPVAAMRRNSTAPGGRASDGYYLVYKTVDGEVQVISAAPRQATAESGRDPLDGATPQVLRVAGVDWRVQGSGREFQGQGNLGDAQVTIVAPNQSVFEQIAAGLQRWGR